MNLTVTSNDSQLAHLTSYQSYRNSWLCTFSQWYTVLKKKNHREQSYSLEILHVDSMFNVAFSQSFSKIFRLLSFRDL